MAGYDVLSCSRVSSIFESGQVREAVRAVAQVRNGPIAVELRTDAEPLALMRETRAFRKKFVKLIERAARVKSRVMRFLTHR